MKSVFLNPGCALESIGGFFKSTNPGLLPRPPESEPRHWNLSEVPQVTLGECENRRLSITSPTLLCLALLRPRMGDSEKLTFLLSSEFTTRNSFSVSLPIFEISPNVNKSK